MNTASNQFRALINRVRGGDDVAAEELMRLYEPHVRRAIRLRMQSPALRQIIDSTDISQSVMTNFFVKLQSGEFKIDTPEQLISLLVRMARNRLIDWVRRTQTLRYDHRKQVPLTDQNLAQLQCDSRQQTEDLRVENSELVEQIRARLNPSDRRLLDFRSLDIPWSSIAERENASAEALRTQLRRSLRRVAVEMGLVET